MTSLTFDLASDQEKGQNPSGEQQRRISLQDGQKNRCHVTRMKLYRVTERFNKYDKNGE